MLLEQIHEVIVKDVKAASSSESLRSILGATFVSASCTGAVLLRITADGWVVVESVGTHADCDYAALNEWLTEVTNCGDVVVFDGNEAVPDYLRGADEVPSLAACITLRGNDSKPVGAALLFVGDRPRGLSVAQRYALSTYSFQLSAHLSQRRTYRGADTNSTLDRLRMLESVVTNAKDAILVTEAEPIDAPGPRIVYCNPAFLQTTGYTEQEILGKTPRLLQCSDTSREALDKIRNALEHWSPIEIDLLNVKKDGTRFWVEVSIVPLADDTGWFTHWVSVQRDVTERKRAQALAIEAKKESERRMAAENRLREREKFTAELSHAASHDALTGLRNRSFLMTELGDAFAPGSTTDDIAALIFVDLDGFKLVNDSLGHVVGDDLLIEVSRRFRDCIGDDGILARLGGDEFAVLLKGRGKAAEAIKVAECLVKSLHAPIVLHGQSVVISCSIGIATSSHTHQQPNELLRDADIAMYEAKKLGKNRWAIFNTAMRNEAMRALLLQTSLREAVEKKDFVVLYQPIYRAEDGEVVALEALLRWVHPMLGNIPPDVFIPIAEEAGFIIELGEWVMRRACTQVQQWRERHGVERLTANVNVSAVELLSRGFVDRVHHILSQTRLPPKFLQIEVTESIFLRQPHAVSLVLDEVKQLGVRISLDDFGTGYSSLGYIDRYPIDAIKIDQSFVSRMMLYPRSRAIIKGILSLGSELGLEITSEGVETPAQYHMLKDMTCPYMQGFFLSKPLTAQDADAIFDGG